MDEMKNWKSFVGQTKMKERLQVYIQAAKTTGEPLKPILFTGPPGVGKTSLANLIAKDLGDSIFSTIMPITPGLLKQVVIKHKGIFFLDEIHRGSKKQLEELMPIIWDGYLQLPNGQRIHNDHLTVVGATTNPEDLPQALFDRFTFKPLFEPYTPEELKQIVVGMCLRFLVPLPADTVEVLATASGGIPRNARQLVVGAKALYDSLGTIPTLSQIMDLSGLTETGLSEYHLLYLSTLESLGGKAGLSTISTVMRLHPKVITELERPLLAQGKIQYSPSGRELCYDTV